MTTLTPSTGAVMPSGSTGYQPPGGTIQLSVLIDFVVQRTYHELQVLSELLPRKTDMERKIEIVQFCSRTRQLFIRLLALVKWANNCGKVDKCAQITGFLDQHLVRENKGPSRREHLGTGAGQGGNGCAWVWSCLVMVQH